MQHTEFIIMCKMKPIHNVRDAVGTKNGYSPPEGESIRFPSLLRGLGHR